MPPSPSRDPIDYSPTTSSLLSTTNHPTTSGSVRRNLFSTHLSRRPASSTTQQPPSQLDGSNERHLTSHDRQFDGPPPPPAAQSRLRTHQRSASTPSLSPSPPRTSPFHNIPASATFIPPPLPPLPQFPNSPPDHLRVALRDDGVYDPTISPNRPLSPRSSAALFPNQSIVALNPITGRPVLPKLPVLPRRLRLTDSDEEMDEGEDEDAENDEEDDEDEDLELVDIHVPHDPTGGVNYGPAPRRQTSIRPARGGPSMERFLNAAHETSRADAQSAAAATAQARAQAEVEADDEATSSRLDRERIERMLREMMARQRARANASATATATAARHGKGVAHPPREQTRAHDEIDEAHSFASHEDSHPEDSEDDQEDDGDDQPQDSEEEELMGLIMGSLRREVVRAEDETWMFGESSSMGALVGRDEVGVYD